MKFISPALKHFIFPLLSRSGYLRRRAGDGPGVVTYHGVFPENYEVRDATLDGNLVHADALRAQLILLQKNYHVITPEDFLAWVDGEVALPPRSILLTCDDALRNTLTEMVPILLEFGLQCLFFATGASADDEPSLLWYEELYLMLLDAMLLEAGGSAALSIPEANLSISFSADNRHAHWWNMVERLSAFDRETRSGFLTKIRKQLKLADDWKACFFQDSVLARRFLTLDRSGLQQMVAAGMTIGAHSLSHPVLARASDGIAWREISESKAVLERALGQTVWAFGYPFGNPATVGEREVRLAEQAGFSCAFMNVGGGLGAKMDRFAEPRVHVTADMGLGEFEAQVSGFHQSLRKMFTRSGNGLASRGD